MMDRRDPYNQKAAGFLAAFFDLGAAAVLTQPNYQHVA
jgi:hypothetical protein